MPLPRVRRRDRGALPELVADAGLVVDAESETALADALARVLSDGRLREELRCLGATSTDSRGARGRGARIPAAGSRDIDAAFELRSARD